MTVTKDQAEMLTALAIAARPHGARRWDHAGVMAALAKVNHLELAEVIKTVGRAAGDRDLDTPAAIGNPTNPCWVERPVERWRPEKTTPEQRCSICSHPRHDGRCPKCPELDEHTFKPDRPGGLPADSARLTKEALKAEIRPFGDRPAAKTTEENDQ